MVYLITQVSIAGLRNSNRVISEFFSSGGPQLEIVLNRFLPRSLGIDEEHITKALTRPVNWKIPSDYLAARRAQNTATPLAMEDSPISQVIRQWPDSVWPARRSGSEKEIWALLMATVLVFAVMERMA